MAPLKIGLIDLVSKGPANTLWAKIMHANLASIMPQVIATWCEREGHEVTMICYTGYEDLRTVLPKNVDLVFISSFTQAAYAGLCAEQLFSYPGCSNRVGRAACQVLSR